jgi:uncharacterized protein YjgD (DUF1641 family)
MARPIPFDAPPRDPRVELQHRLDRAPIEHAEALLSAYDLLQKLHDKGALDMARGLIGSGEKVLEIVTEEANAPESTRALRNGILLFNVLGSIDPDTLKKFTQPIPQAIQAASLQSDIPSVWGLMNASLFNKDFRRGLAAMIGVLRGVGIGLGKPSPADHP